MTNLSDTNDSPFVRAGVTMGGFVVMKVTKMFSFQVDVLYSQEGVKDHITNGAPGTTTLTALHDVNEILDYWRVPLLAHIGSVGKKDKMGLYAVAGPSIGFLRKVKSENNGQTSLAPVAALESGNGVAPASQYLPIPVKSTDIAFVVGGGLNFSGFFVEGRYQMGLRDLKSAAASPANKGQTGTVLLGVRF